ncbi:high-affinity choline transporter 1-like [Hetaerina americana]|uniref:high-affinity choline transporter 1-like n=1 Tax=Hetaerina americana TaxID=62018 RepID=UPI003A7F50FD
MGVVLDMSWTLSVVGTAVFAAIYTMLGGLYSVAYTDVVQVSFVVLGLRRPPASRSSPPQVLSAPFASSNPSAPADLGAVDWLGTLSAAAAPDGPWQWLDALLLYALGGIPSQSYFQRVLATRDANAARLLSLAASGCCLVLALPSIVIGVIAKGTAWSSVEGFQKNVTESEEARSVLPLVVRFMTPEWVSFIGLGAVSAAVMSSVDSSYLSASSLIAKNFYRVILRPKAPDYEVLWVLRGGVVASAAASVTLALSTPIIIAAALFCADLVYVIVFPQLLLGLHWKRGANAYGALASFLVGATLRLLAGDPGLAFPALLRYPLFDPETGRQGAPHRTIAMASALVAHLAASLAARALLLRGPLSPRYDFLGCFGSAEKDPPPADHPRGPTAPPVARVRFSEDPESDLEECGGQWALRSPPAADS